MNVEEEQDRAVELAEEKQIKAVESVSSDKLINTTVKLYPLSMARKLVIGKAVAYLGTSKIYDDDDYSCLLVSVYVLAEKSPLKLMQLSKNPRKLFEKSIKFADDPSIDFEALMEEVQPMVDALDTVESLISDDRDEEETTELEKK
jgi:hypothetical protein